MWVIGFEEGLLVGVVDSGVRVVSLVEVEDSGAGVGVGVRRWSRRCAKFSTWS